ncbi:tyrosine-type recombinase/integrase [Pseudomonas huanghezhanensis]|uniref:tyrosine-type recombinase/integrase n=1 Tax=Pseudomonas huanghezhanensis TaxID=3002903 RepID=UPI00228638AF|nr:site-specific integrase [Pseudomonas sp. BSw22131]
MTTSLKTLHVVLTDSEIRKQSAGAVRQLRDPRFPELRFRYSTTDRTRGAWHVVVRGKWGKAGDYPGISAKSIQSALPAILLRRAIDPEATSTENAWATMGDLLRWYTNRMIRDRSLSEKRKAGAKSALKCHLVPRLANLQLSDLGKASLDSLLMWPMQERYALSFVRLVYNVLAVAMRQAHRLGHLRLNPMAGLKFSDFVSKRVKPKPSRLRTDDLSSVLAEVSATFAVLPTEAVLALMMLCHGTRLGETRMALWRNVNLNTRQWFIPQGDTKTKAEHLLPLTDQVCSLLQTYQAFQRANGYQGAYVFPGIRRGAMSATTATAVFARLSDHQWTSHDLRKVARTAWMDLGIDYLVGEMLVNHALKNMDATYIHTAAENLKREALEKWHHRLDEYGLSAIASETNARCNVSGNPLRATQSKASSAISIPLPRSMESLSGGAQ